MLIEEKQRQLLSTGTHTAILYSIIDLGTQVTDGAHGIKSQHKIQFTWEICDECLEDGRPFSISRRYTASLHEKSQLVSDIRAWTGTAPKHPFNVSALLGKTCNLTVTHQEKNGKTYANIAAITPLKKGEKVPVQINENVIFDLKDFKAATFEKFPPYLKEIIEKSPEYQNLGKPKESPKTSYDDLNDDIPFG